MTERLYYTDSFLTEFDARVVRAEDGRTRIVLDRTAFYPTSGGQPHDTGTLAGVPVVRVEDADDEIVHVLAAPLPESGTAHGVIDWPRRFDHMQQHSGQHLLSAVFDQLFGYRTASFHLGSAASTIDLDTASIAPGELAAAERRANELVWQDLPVRVSFEDSRQAEGLRKEAAREGLLRIITIEGVDRSACGGTHVRSTGQIGVVLVRKTEKIRGMTRVEFLCGGRAIARARADYEALDRTARLFSAALEDVPAAAAGALEQAREAEKTRRRLALELATLRGKALYDACAPEDATGLRIHVERLAQGPPGDEIRAMAQSFCAAGDGLFIAASASPPSVLFACGQNTGFQAGARLKAVLEQHGGRGGGAGQMAQGSLPSAELLDAVIAALLQR
ncbi:MAG: alanyl-tRNA editing protein [Bryobacteraceae bacterium]|nr:MAG: alanyl-tRNA editing protein [Bryobacteraceae bacterium]